MTENWTPELVAEKLKGNPDLRIHPDSIIKPLSKNTPQSNSGMVGVEGSMIPYSDLIKPKKNKYRVSNADDRTYNGKTYRSKKEARFAADLDLRVKAGDIDFWLYEVPFRLPGGTVYRLDFVTFKFAPKYYDDCTNPDCWELEWFEVKGFRTPVGELKRKQCESLYKIKIRVV